MTYRPAWALLRGLVAALAVSGPALAADWYRAPVSPSASAVERERAEPVRGSLGLEGVAYTRLTGTDVEAALPLGRCRSASVLGVPDLTDAGVTTPALQLWRCPRGVGTASDTACRQVGALDGATTAVLAVEAQVIVLKADTADLGAQIAQVEVRCATAAAR